MSAHHVDLPEQVVTPGEELWVKIIDLDLQRRRISLSIKQAAEGGVVAAEYQEHFGEHAYDDEGNYIGAPDSEAQEAWAEYFAEGEEGAPPAEGAPAEAAEVVPEPAAEVVPEPVAEVVPEPVAEVVSEPAEAAEPVADPTADEITE
jgi:small subunit ribosomal protein S1